MKTPSPYLPWLYGILSLFLAGFLGCISYYLLFTTFRLYDDEGYVLLSLREFLNGQPLYNMVYSQYGPFFYWVCGGLFRLQVFPLTHDGARFFVLAQWLICVGVYAYVSWKLTRSVLLALLAQLLVWQCLIPLINEPAHPQGLCVLLVALMPMLTLFSESRWRGVALVGLGVVVAGLALTKINIGIYSGLALALVLAAHTPGRWAGLSRLCLGIIICLLPVLLMRHFLGREWGWSYALIVVLAALPLVLPSTAHQTPRWLRFADWRYVGWGMIGVLALIGMLTWLHGTSFTALIHGVALQHLRFAMVFYIPAPLNMHGVGVACLSVTLYGAYQLALRTWGLTSTLKIAIIVLKFGFFGWVSYLAWNADSARILNFCLAFAWLVVVTPGVSFSPAESLTRQLLQANMVLQGLVAYPVAGSQVAFATVTVLPVAVLCWHDALSALSSAWSWHGVITAAARVGVGALVASFGYHVWQVYFHPLHTHFHAYLPYELSGASRLRGEARQVATYRWLAYNLHEHSDTFFSLPGLNSLYFFADRSPPTSYNATTWMTLFPERQQAAILTRMRQIPRACAVVNPRLAVSWIKGQTIEQMPLVRHIHEDYRAVGRYHGYEICFPRTRPVPELFYCVRPVPTTDGTGEGLLTLPAMPGQRLRRLNLIDMRTGALIASTVTNPNMMAALCGADGPEAEDVLDLENQPLPLDTIRRLRLRYHPARPYAPEDCLGLYLDDGERFIAVVPVLQEGRE